MFMCPMCHNAWHRSKYPQLHKRPQTLFSRSTIPCKFDLEAGNIIIQNIHHGDNVQLFIDLHLQIDKKIFHGSERKVMLSEYILLLYWSELTVKRAWLSKLYKLRPCIIRSKNCNYYQLLLQIVFWFDNLL